MTALDTDGPGWQVGPAEPVLTAKDIHIWRASLDRTAYEVAALRALLSPDERERAARFHRTIDQDRFIVGRGLLRQILSRYVVVAADQLVFGYNTWGKPRLVDVDTGIQFSVAHSDGLILYAVGRCAVGVDIEKIDSGQDVDALARIACSSEEVAALGLYREMSKVHTFFVLWTRKEACLKATGEGLSLDPRGVSALLPRTPGTVFVKTSTGSTEWTVWDLCVSPRLAAAVAAPGAGRRLQCWVWPDAAGRDRHCYPSVTAGGDSPI